MATFKIDTLKTSELSSNGTANMALDSDGATTGTSTTLDFNQTADRVITLPDASGTLLSTTSVQKGSTSTVTQSTDELTTSVTFGTTFSGVPRVMLSYNGLSDTTKEISLTSTNVTTSGFDIVSYVSDAADVIDTTLVDYTDGVILTEVDMSIVNSNPALAYVDFTNTDMYYVRATDSEGTTWGTPTTPIGTTYGRFPSLTTVSGNPAIAYYNFTAQDLYYVRATNANGTAWGSPVLVDTTTESGYNSHMIIVSGNPAIAYRRLSSQDLKYVRATNATGSAWGSPVTLDSTGSVGFNCSMAIVNGNPAVSYYDQTNLNLKYIRASDSTGSTWGTPVTVDSTGDVGEGTCLVVVDGNPAIAYYDDTNSNQVYIRATDANGTAWGSKVTVASANGPSDGAKRMRVMDGVPVMAYGDTALRYVVASNATGSAWEASELINGDGNCGADANSKRLALSEVNGRPAFGYDVNSKIAYSVKLVNEVTYTVDYIATNI